ncbi:hypothetical protein BC829DRAFT_430112 [Chytridium lagenaria]|nr:hypothetical protein BC829DRAFT_430112 [Chytridium lagenaria]
MYSDGPSENLGKLDGTQATNDLKFIRGSGSASLGKRNASLAQGNPWRYSVNGNPESWESSSYNSEEENSPTSGPSEDICSTCMGKGQLICCDSCPRVFHLCCLEDGFNISFSADESWECKKCSSKRIQRKPRALPKGKSSPVARLFSELQSALQSQNPVLFELPREIRDSFDDIIAHPSTGAYLNANDVEMTTYSTRGIKSAKSLEKSTNSQNDTVSYMEDSVCDVDLSFNVPSHHNAFCYKCKRLGLRSSPLSLLGCQFETQPKQNDLALIQQRSKSPMIRCDYCFLWWHLDCLDSPTLLVPPELRNEPEVVNLKIIREQRAKYWGKWAVENLDMLDKSKIKLKQPRDRTALSSLIKKGEESEIVGTPSSASSSSSNFAQIRRKWMCPCHAEWSLPQTRKPRRWKVVTVTEDSNSAEHDNYASSAGILIYFQARIPQITIYLKPVLRESKSDFRF